jgi:hypothetical protein
MAIMVAMAATGCAGGIPGVATSREPTEPIHYDVRLVDVQGPSAAEGRYDASRVARQDSAGGAWYAFQDSLVRVVVAAREAEFSLTVQNRSARAMRIVWAQAAYVDVDGAAHAVTHADAGPTTPDGGPTATVVPCGGRVDETVVPSSRAAGGNAPLDSSGARPLVPATDVRSGARDSAAAALAALTGKRMQLVLPLEIDGAVSPYTLTFVVAGARVGAWMAPPDTAGTLTASAGSRRR